MQWSDGHSAEYIIKAMSCDDSQPFLCGLFAYNRMPLTRSKAHLRLEMALGYNLLGCG